MFQVKCPRKYKMFSAKISFLIIFSGLSFQGERLESPILDHNSRTRVRVVEVSIYRWNKDGKFFGKHLLLRISVTSLSSQFLIPRVLLTNH